MKGYKRINKVKNIKMIVYVYIYKIVLEEDIIYYGLG